ncbi:uncharacterized protein MKK02DRAFT_38014 [Dioszegia hungarica]|uniref:Uncharacterized protein n=1 Tax=Dioszegia hungarica TaxID=4972 RepID=A0AA38LU76_9TREE|nr:uncharacterized protein MKK02DRAFT_38014 [Dioszegia hungarica]KAI9634484.1 hypothetical protein MKK02DRAFT_38014 [Dioszegia hungarica]
MARTRPYTRKELETLRRGDLQNLYKIHGLKGANQKSDALIDSLEEYFISPTYKAIPPGSPNKLQRSTNPIPSVVIPTHSRQLKPIQAQVAPRAPPLRPVTRKSPTKAAAMAPERAGRAAVTAEDAASEASGPRRERPIPAKSAQLPVPNDSLLRRVGVLSDRVQDIESSLTVTPLTTVSGEIASLRAEVSRLDADIASIRSSGVQTTGAPEQPWETRVKEVEAGWAAKLSTAEAVWAERFRVLEGKIGEGSGTGRGSRASEGPQGLSATALGKRREREEVVEPRGFALDGSTSPSKRARTDHTASPSTREHLMALARRSASPTKSPRTPSPGKSSSQGVFKTPELPASLMKQRHPRTPSPGHQGTLPDNSATPAFSADASYFADLPPVASATGRGRSVEVTLPFPLFATTPRPAAPTSPTTDAPPSSARRGRALSAQPGGLMLTPGRRPTRTVSHAHMELSTVTEDSVPASSAGASFAALSSQKGRPPPLSVSPPSNPHQSPLLGPELTREISEPPRLSPSPSITESRFSTLPFPSKNTGPTPRSNLTKVVDFAFIPQDTPAEPASAASTAPTSSSSTTAPAPEAVSPVFAPLAGLGMMTPGHRTMLGTEAYRDTRFGDLPVMMSWGTPEMPDTPRPGGSGGFGSGT